MRRNDVRHSDHVGKQNNHWFSFKYFSINGSKSVSGSLYGTKRYSSIEVPEVKGQSLLNVYKVSLRTGFRKVPIPAISTSTTSSTFKKTGGLRANPTPEGVPVIIAVPGKSVMEFDR